MFGCVHHCVSWPRSRSLAMKPWSLETRGASIDLLPLVLVRCTSNDWRGAARPGADNEGGEAYCDEDMAGEGGILR